MKKPQMLVTVLRRSGLPFSAKVTALSPWLWWKLNEPSGTSIADSAGTNTGTLTVGSGALGQTGIGDGNTALLFDGTATAITKSGNITISDARGREGTMVCWCKLEAATWTDSTVRTMRVDRADAANIIRLSRTATNNALQLSYEANNGGQIDLAISANPTIDWFLFAGTWSDTANAVNVFQVLKGGGTVVTNSAAMSTSFAGGTALCQMSYTGAFLKGTFAHFILFPTALTQAQLVELAKV